MKWEEEGYLLRCYKGNVTRLYFIINFYKYFVSDV